MSDSLFKLTPGSNVRVEHLEIVEKKQKPPKYYTEGTLLDDMKAAAKFIENDPVLMKKLKAASGLGTAATRDAVIEGLKKDGYIALKSRQLHATEKGEKFISWLESVAPALTDVATTARWEAELEAISQGESPKAFATKIEEYVRKMVATLKLAPSIELAKRESPQKLKETKNMSETTGERKASKPTEKMVAYAATIAKRMGIPVPAEVVESFDACKEFIDKNKDTKNPPTEKQLKFADAIAVRKGLQIPASALQDMRELSRWIDQNKD